MLTGVSALQVSFIELACRPAGTGLNVALQPTISHKNMVKTNHHGFSTEWEVVLG
jgi:hypothetical protein